MVLLAYRHGFRVSELVGLRWDAVDFNAGGLRTGEPGQTARPARTRSRAGSYAPCAVYAASRSRSRRSCSCPSATRRSPREASVVARLGVAAGFEFPVRPHMLRHACGFQLANQGTDTRTLQAYLGHKNIQHTVRYTELAPQRFKWLWED